MQTYQADGWTALGDPTRREIFRRLVERPQAVVELARDLPVSRPAVSQHLKVLREAGLVNERRDGTRHLFSANRQTLRQLRDQLAWMWDEDLAELKAAAEREAKTKRRGR